MTASLPDDEAIFHAARAIPDVDHRRVYVRAVCGGDDTRIAHVEALLAAADRPDSLLDRPAGSDFAATIDYAPVVEGASTVIGPYKLIEEIGEGGMGSVWMAQQTEPVRRLVALKLIKAGMDSKQVIARFEAERQALALMDHPNIAKVLDAGTTEAGRPYFVMELVKGIPITKYCDEHQLTPRQRLELFIPVCQAVQHAHQKGIIHRDIKPTNVLVALYDGRPVPKVIDFGIAKAAGQSLTDKTLVTGYGAIVGTLEYMSPEQAEINQLDIDTRSDIYSLGVLLYELLAGSPPFTKKDLDKTGMLEMLRAIREKEPSRPSTKLSTAKGLPTLAANRGTEPAKLKRLVRGDLDWIVMKSLEKDRNRRYQTANGFAMDVQRYLADEAVLACPPSVGYRLRKFTRRNMRSLLTAAVVALVLVAGTVVSTWQAMRATKAEKLANTRLQAETEANNATREQLQLTQKAESQARLELYHSLVAQAHGTRLSRRMGQRFTALDILAKAVKMAREMELPKDEFLTLRNETIACLALPDLRVVNEWDGWPTGSFSADFSGNLERYARVNRQGVVSIRRVAGDSQIASLPGIGPGESWPIFSPDGQCLGLHGSGRFQLWTLSGPAPVKLLEEPFDTFAFSPDSRQLARTLPDGSLCLHDLPSGQKIKQLKGRPGARNLAFHPRAWQLAISFPDTVQILDLETGEIVTELAQPAAAYDLAWHPDGKTLAISGTDWHIHIWDIPTRTVTARLEHTNDGIRFSFNHAGDLLASTCWDGRVHLWNPQTGEELFSSQELCLDRLHFSPDDRFLAASWRGEKLRIWEVAPRSGYHTVARGSLLLRTPFHHCAIHPKGRLLAASMWQGTDFWDLTTGAHLGTIRLATGNGNLLFEPSGALITNGPDGLRRWPVQLRPGSTEMLSIGPPQTLPVPGSTCRIAQSADGRVLASAQHFRNGALVLHPDHPDQPVFLGPHSDVRSVGVSRDGSLVATGSHSGTKVKVWQSRNGKLVKELPIETSSGACFSPDDKWLATTGGGCRLWAINGWAPGPVLGGIYCVFSPDSRLLAVETGQGVMRLVDPDSGREYAQLEDPNQDRAVMTFSPDGTLLVTTSHQDSNSVHVWNLRVIRQELLKRGLDWDLPPYPKANEPKNLPPLQLTIDLGRLTPEKPEQAIPKYTLIIAWMPLNPDAYLRRGHAYFQKQHWRQAADDLGLALALNPAINDWQIWWELGYACTQSNRVKQAIAAYENALKLKPDSPLLHNNLAWLLATCSDTSLRNPARAVTLARKAVQQAQENGMFWNTLGTAYYRAGNWNAAVEALEKSMLLRQNGDAFDYFFLAMAHWQLGHKSAAHKWHAKALTWVQNNQEALKTNRMYEEELRRFGVEAEELLKSEMKDPM